MEKRLACKQIVTHLLAHHFKITDNQLAYIGTELDAAFTLDNVYSKYKGSQNNSENLTMAVVKAFDELAKSLRTLEDLPLVITSVLGKLNIFVCVDGNGFFQTQSFVLFRKVSRIPLL